MRSTATSCAAAGMVVSVETPEGPLRMVGNPIRWTDAPQEHRVPPRLHEHTREVLDAESDRANDQAS